MAHTELLNQTATIVASHVGHNSVASGQLPDLIRGVFSTLQSLDQRQPMTRLQLPIADETRMDDEVSPRTPRRSREAVAAATEVVAEEQPVPAVPINKSITADYLICLEDGKRLRMLKRHLMTHYKFTPDDYRKRWNLPGNYPMVAPTYAQTRSELARKNGLGRSRYTEATQTAPVKRIASEPAVRQIPEGVSGSKRRQLASA